MKQILVVANQTLGSDQLADVVRERLAAEPCHFTVVVPATAPPQDLAANFGSTFAADGKLGPPMSPSGAPGARWRLAVAVEWFRERGAGVEGDIGPENPLQAVSECVSVRDYDEIIVSTLPSGVSRWLHQDLPHRIERKFKLPVTVVTAKP